MSTSGRYTITTPAGTTVSCRPAIPRPGRCPGGGYRFDVVTDIVLPDGRLLVATTSSATDLGPHLDDGLGLCRWIITSPNGDVDDATIHALCIAEEEQEGTDEWDVSCAMRDVYVREATRYVHFRMIRAIEESDRKERRKCRRLEAAVA